MSSKSLHQPEVWFAISLLHLQIPFSVKATHRWLLCRMPSRDAAPVLAAVDAGHRNWRAAAHALYDAAAAGDDDNSPGPGVVLYLLPMGAGQGKGGSSHGWGTPMHSFWCCHGSSVESFAKLADSIFFHRRGAVSACFVP